MWSGVQDLTLSSSTLVLEPSIGINYLLSLLASFTGLPRFSVLQFALTDVEERLFRILLSTQTEEQNERGRTWNEATSQPCDFCVIVVSPLPQIYLVQLSVFMCLISPTLDQHVMQI